MDDAKTIVVGSKLYRPLMDSTLIPDDLKKAREELNETPDVRIAGLKTLRDKLTDEKDLNPRIDDLYLLRFLRTRKYDCGRALKLMKDHYRFRHKHPNVFPAPSTLKKILDAGIFNYLPHRDDKGRAIFLVKIALWNPDEVPFEILVAAGNIVSEYVLDNDVTMINGYVGLWDFKGFSLKRFLPFIDPRNMFMLSSLMQDCFPARFKIAYCVNCHPLVNTAWSLFKPILKEKFRKRVKILGSDLSGLHHYFDPAILPEEYGGDNPPSNCTDFINKVIEKEAYFNYSRKFGYAPKSNNTAEDTVL